MTQITSTDAFASTRYVNYGRDSTVDDLANFTMCVYAKKTGSGGSDLGYMLSKFVAGSGGFRFLIQHNSGNPRLVFGWDSTGSANNPSKTATGAEVSDGGGKVVDNTWQHFWAWGTRSLSASDINLAVGTTDCLVQSGATADGSGSLRSDASNSVIIGNRASNDRHLDGDVGFAAIWPNILTSTVRALVVAYGPLISSGALLVFANNQDYSSYARSQSSRSTRVTGSTPTNTSLGDEGFSASITEAVSAAATQSQVFGGSGSITEAASAAANHSSSTAQSASITESASANATQNGTASGDYTASLTEAAGAADSASQVMSASASITESASAADSGSGVVSAVGSITEAASAAATQSAAAAFTASVIEAATAAATQSQIAYGKFITGILKNINESPHASTAVKYTWTPEGRVGAMAGLFPVDGEGVTGSDGRLEVTLPLGQNGRLDVAIWNSEDAADDGVWTGFGAPA